MSHSLLVMCRRISYIIPTLNEEKTLANTLGVIHAQKGEKEIIVTDGGSSDRTLAIARENGCKTVLGDPGRGTQLNHGAEIATGCTLLFMHADTQLPNQASDEIDRILQTPGVIAGSFRLKFEPSSPALRFYSLCTAINLPLFTFGDQGLFMGKSTFNLLNKFKTYPILEDVEIESRLRRRGRFAKSKLSVVTSSRRFRNQGVIRQQFFNLCIIAAYYGGISPHLLAKYYPTNR